MPLYNYLDDRFLYLKREVNREGTSDRIRSNSSERNGVCIPLPDSRVLTFSEFLVLKYMRRG